MNSVDAATQALERIKDEAQEIQRLAPLAIDLEEVKDKVSHCASCGAADAESDPLELHEIPNGTRHFQCPSCFQAKRHVGPNRKQRRTGDRRARLVYIFGQMVETQKPAPSKTRKPSSMRRRNRKRRRGLRR